MAFPSTRAVLRVNARTRADQDSSDFPTDDQYNVWLDDAAREVWWDLRAAGWPVNFATTTITATGGTTFYPFSGGSPSVTAPVSSVHGVYFKMGADYYPVHRINEGKRAALMSTSLQIAGFAGFYDLRIDPTTGPGIELLPPPFTGSYRVDYIPDHPGFASDSDTWYGPARSDSLVSLRAAVYGCKKEGAARSSDAASLQQEYEEMLVKVTNTASWFDLRNPAKIRDVNSEQGRYAFDYPLAGPDPVGY